MAVFDKMAIKTTATGKGVGMLGVAMLILCAALALMIISGCTHSDSELPEESYMDRKEIMQYTKEEDRFNLIFHFNTPTMQKNEDGASSVSIAGLANAMNSEGLPFFTAKLIPPRDMDFDALYAEWGEKSVLENIVLSKNEFAPIEEQSSNENDFTSFNDGLKATVSVQDYSGVPVIYVTITPVFYQQEASTISYCNDVCLTLTLKERKWNISNLNSDEIDEIKSIVDNPEDVKNN